MSLITGSGEPLVPPTTRRGMDVPAALPELLKDSRFDPAEANQKWSDRGLSLFDAKRFLERRSVYDHVDRAAPEVAALWRAVEGEVEAAVELSLKLEELQGAEKRAVQEHKVRVRAALDAGKPAPAAPKPRDYEAERDLLRGELQVRRERIEAARKVYRDAARAAMPEALAALAGGLEDRRAKAAAAFVPFAAEFRAWRRDIAACDLLARELDADADRLVARTSAHARETAASAVRGVEAVQALLDTDDPVVTGRRHVEPDPLEVPLHVRRAWWDSESQRDLQRLAALEREEGYAISRFTRG
jgi:hypothetical protein